MCMYVICACVLIYFCISFLPIQPAILTAAESRSRQIVCKRVLCCCHWRYQCRRLFQLLVGMLTTSTTTSIYLSIRFGVPKRSFHAYVNSNGPVCSFLIQYALTRVMVVRMLCNFGQSLWWFPLQSKWMSLEFAPFHASSPYLILCFFSPVSQTNQKNCVKKAKRQHWLHIM